jgi:hypothetical protein
LAIIGNQQYNISPFLISDSKLIPSILVEISTQTTKISSWTQSHLYISLLEVGKLSKFADEDTGETVSNVYRSFVFGDLSLREKLACKAERITVLSTSTA